MVVKAVDRFLEREGFKSTHVQLPCKQTPCPSSAHRRSAHGGRAPWIGLSLICFFLIPIMLFGNAQFFTDNAQNYARLCQ